MIENYCVDNDIIDEVEEKPTVESVEVLKLKLEFEERGLAHEEAREEAQRPHKAEEAEVQRAREVAEAEAQRARDVEKA